MPPRCRRGLLHLERGSSLLEVMLSVVIFLLLSAVLFGLFKRMASWKNFELKQREQQSGSLVMGAKLEAALREVSFTTLACHYPNGVPADGDLILSCASSRDAEGRWSETDFVPDDHFRLVFYLDKGRQTLLERRTAAPGTTPVTLPLTMSEMLSEAAQAETRILGDKVESFLLVHPVTDVPTDIITTPLKFRITQSGSGGEKARSVERSVVFCR